MSSRQSLVVPGQGQWKDYSNGKAFDFAYSSALLDYKAGKFLDFQLGYDKNFIGDGYRSMLLSDNSFNYPFLVTEILLSSYVRLKIGVWRHVWKMLQVKAWQKLIPKKSRNSKSITPNSHFNDCK